MTDGVYEKRMQQVLCFCVTAVANYELSIPWDLDLLLAS